MRAAMNKGAVPISLVSTDLFHGSDGPHWVVVNEITDEAVKVNDPWISRDRGQTARVWFGSDMQFRKEGEISVFFELPGLEGAVSSFALAFERRAEGWVGYVGAVQGRKGGDEEN